MKFGESEEFKFPTRRPWLLIVVLLVVSGLALTRYRHGRKGSAASEVPAKPAASALAARSSDPAPQPASANAPARADVAAVPELVASVERAKAYESQGALVKARQQYLETFAYTLSPALQADIEAHLGKVNAELVCSPAPMPEKVDCVVKPGDSLERIAKPLNASLRLIQRSNQIKDANRIRPGDMLRVLSAQFTILVSKARNDMIVYMNDVFFKRYRVATGKFGKTPLGTFAISDQIVEPTWWRPDGKEIRYGDKENILGTRWMALKATGDTPDVRGYGIHGTWDDASLGRPVSQGCVRMRNSDVEELFDIVPPGTQVVIAE